MKKLPLLLLLFLLAPSVIQIQAQESKNVKAEKGIIKETKKVLKNERKTLHKLERSDVNIISKNSFTTDFGNVPDVRWRSSTFFDEATFTRDGKEMIAYYDFDGKLVGTCSNKTFADLPVKAQSEIRKRYKDYTIGTVILFDDNEFNESDMMLYSIQFEDEDNYFVELTKNNSKIILKVTTAGAISFFKQL